MVQSKTACHDLNDAAFDITFKYDAGGSYSFWWPSLDVDKSDGNSWPQIISPGTTSFTLEGFGAKDAGKYLYVYSVVNKWLDSIPITTVNVFDPFSPGAIITSSSTVCAGGTPVNIANYTEPSGGSGTYTYEWYKGGVKIDNAPNNSSYIFGAETAEG
ncbi:MAG: hypothetical protein LBD52_08765, partial [Prevotellaceae bacterium]|nr:hypothetical protein [Prevotellaceae bacterium]